MAVLQIYTLPALVLSEKTKRVTTIDESIQKLIDDMVETLRANSSVGLSAPQVGVSLSVAVIEVPGRDVITLINPEIVKRSGKRRMIEACLSVPGQTETKRAKVVKVKAQDRQGRWFTVKGHELLAQALEHEVDHLNGVLIYRR